MSLAESYHHLLLEQGAEDTALSIFQRLLEVDPDFTPALIHLAEYNIRRGETGRAEQLVDKLKADGARADILARLEASLECVQQGAGGDKWRQWAQDQPTAVVMAGMLLAASGAQLSCAEEAYLVSLDLKESSASNRWGARLAYQSLLLAKARFEEMSDVLDSAKDDIRRSTLALYLMDAAAGAPVDDRAREVAAERCVDPPRRNAPMLWLCSLWAHHLGDAAQLQAIAEALTVKLDSTRSRRDSLITGSAVAYATLASGDSVTATNLFRALRPTGNTGDLAWQPWEPLAAERITLARLLLARGDYSEAHRVAAALEHPQPVIYVAFLPASLSIQIEAAEAMGNTELAEIHRQRLAGLRRR